MIFKVTYFDENGYPLQEATFNSDTVKEAIGHILTVPTLHPPENTTNITIEVQQ